MISRFRSEYISILRKNRKFRLSDLADKLHFSISELSKMLSGRREISNELFLKMLQAMDIKWNDIDPSEFESTFWMFFDEYYFLNKERCHKIIKEIWSEKEKWIYSPCFFLYSLTITMYSVFLVPDFLTWNERQEALSLLSNSLSLFSKDLQLIILDLVDYDKWRNSEFSAYEILKSRPAIMSAQAANKRVDAVITCHQLLYQLLAHQNYGLEKIVDTLRLQFASDRNLHRLVCIDYQYGMMLTNLQEFVKAKEVLMNILPLVAHKEEELVYELLIRNALSVMNWKEAAQWCKYIKYTQYFSKIQYSVFAPFILYQVGDLTTADEMIRILLSRQRSKKEKQIILVQKHLLTGCIKTCLNKLKPLLNQSIRNREVTLLLMLLIIKEKCFEQLNWTHELIQTLREEKELLWYGFTDASTDCFSI